MSEAIKRASFAIEDMAEGGGNLWGSNGAVRATLTKGHFTKEAPDNYGADGNPIFGVAFFEIAGDAPIEERQVSQSYNLGATAGDNFTISGDGQYLIPTTDHAQVVKTSKFGTFACSLQNEGVSKTVLANFSWDQLAGLVGDWKRIADKERTGLVDKPGQKKKFPPATLCLVKLHSLAGEKGKTTTTTAATTAASTTASTAPAASTGTGDVDGDALDALKAALSANGGTLNRGRVVLAVSKQVMSNPNRQQIAKRASEEAFLNELQDAGIIKYAASEKNQPISLAA